MIVTSTKRSVTVIAGLSGYGKNTAMLRVLINGNFSARFLFDPDPGEFNPDFGEFADRLNLEPTETPYHLDLHLMRPGGWMAFDPHYIYEGDPQTGVNFWCDFAWTKSLYIPGEKAVVIDELWNYVSPAHIPAPIRRIALSGRKRKIQLFVLTQEPHKMPDTLKGGVSEMILFRLQCDKIDSLRRFVVGYGFNPEEIASLPPLQFVARNLDSGGELRGRIPFL